MPAMFNRRPLFAQKYVHEQTHLPKIQSDYLFSQTREIRIQHEGEEYRLRLTRNNKLILTK